jgi:hypothetical protein
MRLAGCEGMQELSLLATDKLRPAVCDCSLHFAICRSPLQIPIAIWDSHITPANGNPQYANRRHLHCGNVPRRGLAGFGPSPMGLPPAELAVGLPGSEFLPSSGPSGSEPESRTGSPGEESPYSGTRPSRLPERNPIRGFPNDDSASSVVIHRNPDSRFVSH